MEPFEKGTELCGFCHSKDRTGDCHCICHTPENVFTGFHEICYGLDSYNKKDMDLAWVKRFGSLD